MYVVDLGMLISGKVLFNPVIGTLLKLRIGWIEELACEQYQKLISRTALLLIKVFRNILWTN